MDDYDIQTDADVKELFRALTLYEDSPDEIDDGTLDTQLRAAKIRLSNKIDGDNWYSDSGLGQALLGTTLIMGKCAMENYSVSAWDMGAGSIDVSGAGDVEQAQFSEWASMVSEGIQAADNAANDAHNDVGITKTFIGGY
jgi:hypothetical protein